MKSSDSKAALPATAQNKPRKLWKAGELSRRTGLSRQALHQYVLLGLLTPVEMTKGGQRLFSEDAADRVALIRNLCASGYTLADVRDIFFKGKA